MFASLFEKYDRLVLFDTETTGLTYSRDEIIEFAAVVVEAADGEAKITREYDELVALSPGGFVPPKIEQLTGISTQDLRERGLSKTRICRDIAELIAGNTLLLAYNAHFDLSFLFYLLLRSGDPAILKGKDKLDLLTVYKDRHKEALEQILEHHKGQRHKHYACIYNAVFEYLTLRSQRRRNGTDKGYSDYRKDNAK